jgi:hypothetical protein
MTALYVRSLVRLRPLYWLAAVLAVSVISSRVHAAQPIIVDYDQAKIIKVPDRAATAVLGNPFIADISIQPGGLAVITGKSFGDTNLIILDKSGAVLNEQDLRVRGPTEPTVVVYRGTNRETYSCSPDCQRHVIPGDELGYFTDTMTEINARNGQSLGAGTGGGAK